MLINKYSNFSIKTPECNPGVAVWVADFKLDADVTHLFPYINAVTKTVYLEKPIFIQFYLDGIKCALYSDKVSAVPFSDKDQAIDFIKKLIDFLNDIDSRKDTIEPDYNTYKRIPVLEIYKLLPQSNCKKCGYQTCMAFANALSLKEAALKACNEINSYSNENEVKLQTML